MFGKNKNFVKFKPKLLTKISFFSDDKDESNQMDTEDQNIEDHEDDSKSSEGSISDGDEEEDEIENEMQDDGEQNVESPPMVNKIWFIISIKKSYMFLQFRIYIYFRNKNGRKKDMISEKIKRFLSEILVSNPIRKISKI